MSKLITLDSNALASTCGGQPATMTPCSRLARRIVNGAIQIYGNDRGLALNEAHQVDSRFGSAAHELCGNLAWDGIRLQGSPR
jgi:hypothetical protein